MLIGHLILFWLLIIQGLLLITALVVICLNNEMSTLGRVVRILIIFFFPLLGPIAVLIQVLSWRMKKEEAAKSAQMS